ncbi:MAG: DinB family protein [Candidatus Hydrogenedentes bacterium]|nr:DinB family protein [Candidatus Hydrogenedentota bacterium]
MDAARQIELFRFFRGLGASMLDGLEEAQLLAVPEGLSNNILWNLGHVLFYESVFLYGQSDAPQVLPENYGELFKAGSSPKDWDAPPDVAEVVERYKTQVDQTASDFEAGKFSGFKPMNIRDQVTLGSFEESLAFHCFHEGIHLGRIGALKSLV